MSLITEKQTAVFDLTQINRGNLLWGRHASWSEGKAGFVTSATENQLIVQYFPGIGNITNHFIVPLTEVLNGQWEIRWSADLSQVQEYSLKADEGEQETEGAEDNDTGGIDL